MAESLPVDLSPFRSLVSFAAGSHFALVTLGGNMTGEPDYPFANSWIEFLAPALGNLGISYEWEYRLANLTSPRAIVFGMTEGPTAKSSLMLRTL